MARRPSAIILALGLLTACLSEAPADGDVDPADPAPDTRGGDTGPAPAPDGFTPVWRLALAPHLVHPDTPSLTCGAWRDVGPDTPTPDDDTLQPVEVTWTLDGTPAGSGPALDGPFEAGQRIACAGSTGPDGEPLATDRDAVVVYDGPVGTNLIVVVLDDVGLDHWDPTGTGLAGLDPSLDPAPVASAALPTLDALADEGIAFDRVYVEPVCSPTRGAILTGRHPMNTGLGTALGRQAFGLDLAAWVLPEALDGAGYASAAVGKWHVTGEGRGETGPNDHGFDHFAGSLSNIGRGANESYFAWSRTEDGTTTLSRDYATTDTIDSALAWLDGTATEPFVLWTAFHAAHSPWHVPPEPLPGSDTPLDAEVPELFDAMLAAMDAELGRLLDGLAPLVRERTTVVVVSDNGTPPAAARPPFDPARVKGTVYEGGIRVPMVVSGPAVTDPGRSIHHAVMGVDLLPTLTDLAGLDLSPRRRHQLDGTTLLPLLVDPDAPAPHEVVYAEYFTPNTIVARDRQPWNRAVVGHGFKLIQRLRGSELYDLRTQGLEGSDLLEDPGEDDLEPEAAAALTALRDALDGPLSPRPGPLPGDP